jgi:catalase
MVENAPNSFQGRKVGALVTDGVDSEILQALKTALKDAGAQLEIIAPSVGGVEASDGSWIEAAQKTDGGPSVLYDAVALLPSEDGVKALLKDPAARDFVADAFAHLKFIAYVATALPLVEKAAVSEVLDEGFIELAGPEACGAFLDRCRQLRFWEREVAIKQG